MRRSTDQAAQHRLLVLDVADVAAPELGNKTRRVDLAVSLDRPLVPAPIDR